MERHHRRLLRVCERLLGDREEARDAVQEVLLKVLHKAGGFRPRALVSTWLYRIAVNHCLNVLRRRRLVRMLSLTVREETSEEGRAVFRVSTELKNELIARAVKEGLEVGEVRRRSHSLEDLYMEKLGGTSDG